MLNTDGAALTGRVGSHVVVARDNVGVGYIPRRNLELQYTPRSTEVEL